MLADIEVEEFEKQWEAMVEECGVREVEWVKDLYTKKLSWATAYIRGCFFAGLRTTSRCESLHAKLRRFVESRYGILEFVTNFQRCVDFLRDNEEELDFRSLYGTPVLQTQFPELEKSGAVNYTREIYFRYRESLKRCVRTTILECKQMEEKSVYVTQKYRRPELKWNVEHDHRTDSFYCTCLRMESFGLPCVHILAVLVRLDVASLPKSLVLQRWSKTAKVHVMEPSIVDEGGDAIALYKSRVGVFLHHCKRFAAVASMRDEDFKVYLEKVVGDTVVLELKNGVGRSAVAGTDNLEQDVVRDPVGVRTKGTGRGHEPLGSRGIKRRKCSTCGELGHRRTRCPNGLPTETVATQDTNQEMLSQTTATGSGNRKNGQRLRKTRDGQNTMSSCQV
ncbi:hypothetical protein S245_009219 [Arachis hypogaea]